MRQAIADVQLIHQMVEPGRVDLGSGEIDRQHDVLPGRERGHKIERLEDEADVVAAQLSEAGVV